MFDQLLKLSPVIITVGIVVALLGELLLTWASTALVDASPGLLRLCIYTLLAMAVSSGATYGASIPIDLLTADWQKAADPTRFNWSLLALLIGVFTVCALVLFGLLAWPVLSISLKQSALVGLFTALLRVLLWSLILSVVMIVLASMQIRRDRAEGPSISPHHAAPAIVSRA
jgi:hypothetical protein